MASKNEHTGDLIMSKAQSQQFRDNYTAIFGDKKASKRGRFVYDRETKQLVPADEFYERQAAIEQSKRSNLPLPAIQFFKPYVNDINGKLIESPTQERELLKRTGCRIYEGLEQEKKVADQVKREQKAKQSEKLGEMLAKTRIALRDGMTPKPILNKN
jgi:hypothetical protein